MVQVWPVERAKLPLPAPVRATVRLYCWVELMVKVAVTVFAEVTATVQTLPVTESQPLQLVKTEPAAGLAVTETDVPLVNG